jgi:Putative phage serine protease XkdF
MCTDCGCLRPADDHGDPAHIVLAVLQAAADASGIPLAQAAANILITTAVVLAPDDRADGGSDDVTKSAAEQRYVLGIAYQAGPDPRIAKGVDGGRDYFTEAELEKAAWQFLRNGPQVGIMHIDGTEGAAEIVESYIYRGPDWDLGDDIVVKSGDWLLGGILDERAWQLHKAGKINGWSPQGVARRRKTVRRAA